MNIVDQIGLFVGGSIIVLTVVSVGAAKINSWAVLNHHARIATLASAASREAGRLADLLGDMDPAAVTPEAKATLISQGGQALAAEFNSMAPKVGLTAAKASLMIWGELGKIPGVPAISAPLNALTASTIQNAIKNGSAVISTKVIPQAEATVAKVTHASPIPVTGL